MNPSGKQWQTPPPPKNFLFAISHSSRDLYHSVTRDSASFVSDNLHALGTTIRLSRKTISVIRQNYAIALTVNAGGILVGALGAINPFLAAAMHNLSTLLVVFNSARLIGYEPEPRS
jgi:cation transport ATPase